MLYLGYVLLRYVLIYNLEVSFNFLLTFLQLDVIKMFTVQQKLFFTLLSAIFFELAITRTPDNSILFSISLGGSSYRESTVIKRITNDFRIKLKPVQKCWDTDEKPVFLTANGWHSHTSVKYSPTSFSPFKVVPLSFEHGLASLIRGGGVLQAHDHGQAI